MNKNIYSTLFKTQEINQIEEAKKYGKEWNHKTHTHTHTNKRTRTCDPKYQTIIYCINIKLLCSLKAFF